MRRSRSTTRPSKSSPISPLARCNLGIALYDKNQPDEAITEYRKAIELNPDYTEAHYNLGFALYARRQPDEAIAEYRKALQIQPNLALVHNNLGVALQNKGQWDEAIAEYRQALHVQPDLALARNNLGVTLDLAERDALLPAILHGEAEPADAVQMVRFADFCQRYKMFNTAASRFYAEAFAAEPGLAEDLSSGARYNAACAAARAGCGQGKDAATTDAKERGRWRNQALGWLRDDLALWKKEANGVNPKSRVAATQVLQHWKEDSDLAGVRDADGLAKLPGDEREAWSKLWADVDAALKKNEVK